MNTSFTHFFLTSAIGFLSARELRSAFLRQLSSDPAIFAEKWFRLLVSKLPELFLFGNLVLPSALCSVTFGAITILLSALRYFSSKPSSSESISQILPFLNQVILQVSTGQSLHRAVIFSTTSVPSRVRKIFLEEPLRSKREAELKRRISHPTWLFFWDSMDEIHRSGGQNLSQLRALRSQIEMLESFRHKSGQIKEMAMVQAVLMTVFFVAVTIFVSLQYGLIQNIRLISFSVLLFCAGHGLIQYLPRRFRWKV